MGRRKRSLCRGQNFSYIQCDACDLWYNIACLINQLMVPCLLPIITGFNASEMWEANEMHLKRQLQGDVHASGKGKRLSGKKGEGKLSEN